jgi:hypothetical protein
MSGVLEMGRPCRVPKRDGAAARDSPVEIPDYLPLMPM